MKLRRVQSTSVSSSTMPSSCSRFSSVTVRNQKPMFSRTCTRTSDTDAPLYGCGLDGYGFSGYVLDLSVFFGYGIYCTGSPGCGLSAYGSSIYGFSVSGDAASGAGGCGASTSSLSISGAIRATGFPYLVKAYPATFLRGRFVNDVLRVGDASPFVPQPVAHDVPVLFQFPQRAADAVHALPANGGQSPRVV